MMKMNSKKVKHLSICWIVTSLLIACQAPNLNPNSVSQVSNNGVSPSTLVASAIVASPTPSSTSNNSLLVNGKQTKLSEDLVGAVIKNGKDDVLQLLSGSGNIPALESQKEADTYSLSMNTAGLSLRMRRGGKDPTVYYSALQNPGAKTSLIGEVNEISLKVENEQFVGHFKGKLTQDSPRNEENTINVEFDFNLPKTTCSLVNQPCKSANGSPVDPVYFSNKLMVQQSVPSLLPTSASVPATQTPLSAMVIAPNKKFTWSYYDTLNNKITSNITIKVTQMSAIGMLQTTPQGQKVQVRDWSWDREVKGVSSDANGIKVDNSSISSSRKTSSPIVSVSSQDISNFFPDGVINASGQVIPSDLEAKGKETVSVKAGIFNTSKFETKSAGGALVTLWYYINTDGNSAITVKRKIVTEKYDTTEELISVE